MRWILPFTLMAATAVQAADILPDQSRGIRQDAIYGQALYSLHSGDYATALTLNNKLRHEPKRGYGKILDLHKATAQLGLGMSQNAKSKFGKLISDKRISFVPNETRSQAWFYLAKHFYNKGMWASALKAIRKINPTQVNAELKDEYHFVALTLELFKGNLEKADKHLLAINPESKWAAYGFLNLAVSYTERDIHINKVDAVFDKALALTQNTDNPEALADKIHLMAGQFYYSTARGRSAIKHLKNVSLEGAYTPKALLTYGWALSEQWLYHDALQPWYMLKTNHSQLNQDVQETLIAIPYLLEKLNAKVMALGAFDYAVDQYDEIYKKLGASATRLNTGEFIEPLLAQQIPDRWGAFAPVDLSLPDHPDQVYLKDIMSEGYFQGELKNLRDLHVMRSQLKGALVEIDAFDQTAAIRKKEFNQIKKEKAVQIKRKTLAKLKKRHKKLLAKIDKAFGKPDGTGLASDKEKETLKQFTKTSERISSVEKTISAAHYERRLRRVQGVLKWQLSERYNQRKKRVAANLAILDRKVKQVTKQLDAAEFAYKVAPKAFAGFSSKHSKLRKKYKRQLAKLDKVYAKQREKVGGIVKADIKKRQERIVSYKLQARLAAARLFDETSNKKRLMEAEQLSLGEVAPDAGGLRQ